MRAAWSQDKWLKEYYKYFACQQPEWVACLHLWKPSKHSFWIGAKCALEPRTPLFWLVSHPFWHALPGGAELKLGKLHMCLGILVPVSFNHKNNLLFEAPRMPNQGSAVSLLGGKRSQWAFKKFNVPQCTYLWYLTSSVTEFLVPSFMLCGILIKKRWHEFPGFWGWV